MFLQNALAFWYLINDTSFRVTKEGGGVPFGVPLSLALQLIVILLHCDGLPHNYVITRHPETWTNYVH